KPKDASCRITTSRIGYSPIGMSGFGKTMVYGRNRLPAPPARITARLDIVDAVFVLAQVLLLAEPGDGLAESLLERQRGRKTGRLLQFAVVAKQAINLARFRAKALSILEDFDILVHQ